MRNFKNDCLLKVTICSILLNVLIGCSNDPKNHLELIIENSDVEVFCPNDDCTTESEFNAQRTNVLEISLRNNSDNTYLLLPNCILNNEIGCTFTPNSGFLSLESFIIKNSQDVDVDIDMLNSFYMHNTIFQQKQNSTVVTDYGKLGYKNDTINLLLRNYLDENFIIISPYEVLNFENYISLPLNFHPDKTLYEELNLSKKEEYTFALVLHSEITNIEHLLPKRLIKNIETNNLKLFEGDIVSNPVPLRFVDSL